MNIEVITDDYGSMGRVLGSELHIIVESVRIKHPYSGESNGKEEEKRLIIKAEKLKIKIERAVRLEEIIDKRLLELKKIDNGEAYILEGFIKSMMDEANSYIMKDVTES